MKCGYLIIFLIVKCVAVQNATESSQITEIEITKEVNFDAKFAKTFSGIFMMTANKVYLVNITKSEKRFDQIGKIDEVGEDVTGFEAVSWENRVIFIVAHVDFFNVYNTEIVRSDAVLKPVQKVAIFGKFVRAVGFQNHEDLFLVIGTNFTGTHGRLSLYKWQRSAFHLQEEKNLQSLSDLAVLTENGTPTVFSVRYARRRSSKTSVQTFLLLENKLRRTHNLYVDSNLVLPASENGSYFILACSSRLSVCRAYSVGAEALEEVEKEALNTTFEKLAYGKNVILAEAQGGEFIIFENLKFKEFVKFKLNVTDFETSTNLIAIEDDEGTSFAVISYIRPDKVQLKIFEIPSGLPQEENELKSQQKAAYAPLLNLNKILLTRKNEIENLKVLLGWRNNLKSNEIPVKNSTSIKSGSVQKVIVKNRNFLSVSELKIKLDQLRERLQNLNMKYSKNTKKKRSAGDDLKLKTLKVKNLLFNGTIFEGIERVRDENKIILKSERVATKGINFENFQTVIQENITVEEVSVRKINGIEWNRFYEDVFLKNRDSTVEGDFIFRGPTIVKNLETQKINDRTVGDFFTLKTDQEISSNILASKIKVASILADDLNGIRFEMDVASTGKPLRFIETPIVARSVKIEKNLTLSKNDHKTLVRHIARNLGSEFLQLYKNKVVINGTLTINDLRFDPKIQSIIDGNTFNTNFEDVYWMKSVDQKFEDVTLRGLVEVQKIQTDRLNGVDLSDYLLNENEPSGSYLLIINSSTIQGSVFNENDILPSKLLNLNITTIRKGEKAVFYDGIKEFAEVLKINNLKTEEINGKPVDDFVTKDLKQIEFSRSKEFSSIVVNSEFLTDHLKVQNLNDLQLEEFFKNSIDVRSDMILKKLILTGRSSFSNIYFDFLNNIEISKISEILEITENDRIILDKTVIVEGDGIFEKGIETLWINDLNWNNYVKLIVFLNESTEIGGIKTFTDTLTVQDTARFAQINGVNIKEFFEGVLLKSRSQNIKNMWNFGSINFKSDLSAPWIDGIKTELLIDTKDTPVKIESDFIVEDLKISGSIYGFVDNNFGINRIKNDLLRFDNDYWKGIKVIKTAKFITGNNVYTDLLKNAVLKSIDQSITGKVTFKNEIFFESINSSYLINDIDYLYRDCLLKKSTNEQVVLTEKKLLSDIFIKSAQSHNHLDVDIVNNIDIFGFNSSIYRLSENDLIIGKKIFKNLPPVIEYFQIYGLVNNDDLSGIIKINDLETFLPPIRFIDVKIDTPVTIEDINGVNFDYFLSNRAKLEGLEQEFYGNLIFERLSLSRNTTVTSINNIDIIDIIEKSSKSLQEVYGEKIITGNLHLLGPAHVGYLNGIDLTERYDKTINLKKDYEINEAVLNHGYFDRGINVSLTANGHYIDEYLFWYKMYNETVFRNFEEINDHINLIYTTVNRKIINNRFLYLEHDTSINGIWGKYVKNPVKEEIFKPNCLDSDPKCLCGSKKLLLQISPSGRMFVSTPKNPMLKNTHYDFQAVANNFCDRNSSASELNISWDFGYYEKNLTFNYFISDLQTFDLRSNTAKFLLIKFVLGMKNTPLILVKLDTVKNQILPIQSFREGVGFVLNFKVYTFSQRVFVVMSSETKITLYEFDPENEIFTKIQEIFGPYNVFELMKIDKFVYHLILTCRSCDTIAIYAMNTRNAPQFELFQNIRISTKISGITQLFGKFLIFKMTAIDGRYHVFKHSKIQGWTLVTFGNFPNIEAIFPLQRVPNSGHDKLLLTSWNRSAVVTLHSQG